MKKTVIYLLIALPLMLAASCLTTSCKLDLNMNNGTRIEPSTNIVKNEYKQKAFTKVDIDVVANVKFIQDDTDNYRVKLSCPENYVDLFRFNVEGGELKVDFSQRNINIDAKNVDITIYGSTLQKLENSGVASVEVDRLTADELEVDNSGVGKIYLSGLKVRKLDADCSGVGGMELSGTADEARYECSGVGGIEAQNLKAKKVEAEVSGVGGITCHASEEIEGEVSGVGSLKFAGHPKNRDTRRTGVGKITEI
jgi:hypothetical protein